MSKNHFISLSSVAFFYGLLQICTVAFLPNANLYALQLDNPPSFDVNKLKIDFREYNSETLVGEINSRADFSDRKGTIEFWISRTWQNELFNESPDDNQSMCVISNGGTNVKRKVKVARNQGFNRVEVDEEKAFLTAKWAVNINEREIYFQSGETTVATKLFGQDRVLELNEKLHVAIVFSPGATTGQVRVTPYVNGLPRQASQIGWNTAVGGGLLRVGSFDGQSKFLIGLVGQVRIWSETYDAGTVGKLMRYPQFYAGRGIRCPGTSPGISGPQFSNLVTFVKPLSAGDRFQNPIAVEGSWVNANQKNPKPGPPPPGFSKAFGDIELPPAFSVVRIGKSLCCLYRDGIFAGYFRRTGPTPSNWQLQLREGIVLDASFKANPDRIEIKHEGQLARFGVPASEVMVLERPTSLDGGKPVEDNSTLIKGDSLKYYKTNFRTYDIGEMQAVEFWANTGTEEKFVFVPPEEQDATDYYKAGEFERIVPNGLHFLANTTNVVTSEAQLVSSQREMAAMYSAHLGGSAMVSPGVTLSANVKFQNNTENLSSNKSSSIFTEASWVDHRLVFNPAQMQIHPDFAGAIVQLQSDLDFEKFRQEWGTHYAVGVTYGGMMVYEHEMTESMFKESAQYEVDVEAGLKVKAGEDELGGLSAGVGTNQKTSKEKLTSIDKSKVQIVGENKSFATKTESQTANFEKAVPIYLDLRPLYELLSPMYFDDPKIYHDLRTRMRSSLSQYSARLTSQVKSAPSTNFEVQPDGSRIYKSTIPRYSETYRVDLTQLWAMHLYEATYGDGADSTADVFGKISLTAKVRGKDGNVAEYKRVGTGDKYPFSLWERTEAAYFEFPEGWGDIAGDIPKEVDVVLGDDIAPQDVMIEVVADLSENSAWKSRPTTVKTYLFLGGARPEKEMKTLREQYSGVYVFTDDDQEASGSARYLEADYAADREYLNLGWKAIFRKGASDKAIERKFKAALEDQLARRASEAEVKLGPAPIIDLPYDKSDVPTEFSGRDLVSPQDLVFYDPLDCSRRNLVVRNGSQRGFGLNFIAPRYDSQIGSVNYFGIQEYPQFKEYGLSLNSLECQTILTNWDPTEFTICFDAKPASSPTTMLSGEICGDSGQDFRSRWISVETDANGALVIKLLGFNLILGRYLDATIETGATLRPNQWNRIIVAYDWAARRVYGRVNGMAFDKPVAVPEFMIAIAGSQNSAEGINARLAIPQSFKGQLDEFFLFDSALNPTQVQQLHDRPRLAPTAETPVIAADHLRTFAVGGSNPRSITGFVEAYTRALQSDPYFLEGEIPQPWSIVTKDARNYSTERGDLIETVQSCVAIREFVNNVAGKSHLVGFRDLAPADQEYVKTRRDIGGQESVVPPTINRSGTNTEIAFVNGPLDGVKLQDRARPDFLTNRPIEFVSNGPITESNEETLPKGSKIWLHEYVLEEKDLPVTKMPLDARVTEYTLTGDLKFTRAKQESSHCSYKMRSSSEFRRQDDGEIIEQMHYHFLFQDNLYTDSERLLVTEGELPKDREFWLTQQSWMARMQTR